MAPPFAIDDSIHLRRVRLHGAAGDRLQAQRRFERALAPLGGGVPGLPDRALLVVRRMVADFRLRKDAGTGTTAQRVQAALVQHARAARRPWLHADAATADAVLFTDEAEMVACLVRDWLHGVVAERWWWRSVLGEASPGPWLRRQVLARGEVLVPASVRLLEGAGPLGRSTAALEAWFARLDDVQAQEARASLERNYALASPLIRSASAAQDSLERAFAPAAPVIRSAPAGSHRHAASARAPATLEGPELRLERDDALALRRLASTAPELRDSTLRLPQRRLLAQVLALVRAPSWARTPQLAMALSVLEHFTSVSEVGHGACREATLGFAPVAEARVAGQAEARESTEVPSEWEPSYRQGDRRGRLGEQRSRRSYEHRAMLPNPVPDKPNAPEAALAAAPCEARAPREASAVIAAAERPHAPVEIAVARPPSSDVNTAFGGIFYLLNAALALGLYGDFTTPRAPGIALSPWDWLALIGRAWFGGAFIRDPVWTLLASLAGRPGARDPGSGFVAPAAWEMNPDWLAPWGRVDSLRIQTTRWRLSLRHTAGFLVLDVVRERSQRPLDQARVLCAKYAELRGARLSRVPAPGAPLPRPGTSRWLRCLLGYLEARLALALGVGDAEDVASLVCRHAARVTASASDVDVALSLAGLPLAIRFAGLDRDPGWVPAAGRSIAFHFA